MSPKFSIYFYTTSLIKNNTNSHLEVVDNAFKNEDISTSTEVLQLLNDLKLSDLYINALPEGILFSLTYGQQYIQIAHERHRTFYVASSVERATTSIRAKVNELEVEKESKSIPSQGFNQWNRIVNYLMLLFKYLIEGIEKSHSRKELLRFIDTTFFNISQL